MHLEAGAEGAVCCFCGSPQGRTPDLRLVAINDGPVAEGLDVLRAARLARGETLEQAARFTCIGLRYLRALEEGDTPSLDANPGHVYARFFLREYAEHLGLEPGPLLRQLDRDSEPALLPAPSAPTWRRAPRARRWAIGAFLLLVALLTANAVFPLETSDRPDVPLVADTPSVVATKTPKPSVPPPARPERMTIGIETTAPSWILAVVNGITKVEETVPAGERLEFHSTDRIDLRLGNAGGVRLTVNGRPIETGDSANVVDLSFAWRDGHVVRL